MSHELNKHLQRRVALVTGASRGLGREIAAELAASGALVAVNYAASRAGADETVAIAEARGGVAAAFCADVTDPDACLRLVHEVRQHFDADVEIIVNNATGPQPMLPVEESTWQDYLDQLDFFVRAPLNLLQAALPGMRRLRRGSIVNIGSEVVVQGSAPFATYVAAKAALLGLTRSWARELGPIGIRVNIVAPGWIPVERHEGLATDGYLEHVPLGRMGVPSDIAAAVAFLAGDHSSFITGQSLTVNGGATFA